MVNFSFQINPRINVAYACISISDICEKLKLGAIFD